MVGFSDNGTGTTTVFFSTPNSHHLTATAGNGRMATNGSISAGNGATLLKLQQQTTNGGMNGNSGAGAAAKINGNGKIPLSLSNGTNGGEIGAKLMNGSNGLGNGHVVIDRTSTQRQSVPKTSKLAPAPIHSILRNGGSRLQQQQHQPQPQQQQQQQPKQPQPQAQRPQTQYVYYQHQNMSIPTSSSVTGINTVGGMASSATNTAITNPWNSYSNCNGKHSTYTSSFIKNPATQKISQQQQQPKPYQNGGPKVNGAVSNGGIRAPKFHHRSTSATSSSHKAAAQPPLKLVVIGSGGVGKSAITIQFVQQYFIPNYDPTIADTYQKNMILDGELIRLEVYDTAGQDEFAALREASLREADGFLLVFSVSSRESLEYVCQLQRFIEVFKDRDFFPMILVGNKCDLEDQRQVGRVEAEQLAMSWRISYFECSAKYNRVISQIFEELVRLVRQFQFKEKHCNGSVPWLLNGVGGGDRPDTRNSNTVEKSKKKRKNCPIQ